jgi:hypothetical protein
MDRHAVLVIGGEGAALYQARELIHELWPVSSAAGREGTRMSRMMTLLLSIETVDK